MANNTKLNLNNQRFDQKSGDTLNLSGNTKIYGQLVFESGTTFNIKTNAGTGKIFTSDSGGTGTWQNIPITSIGTNSQIIFNSGGTLIGNYKLTYCNDIDALQINAYSYAYGLSSVAMAAATARGYKSVAIAGGCTCSGASYGIGLSCGLSAGCFSFAVGAGSWAMGDNSVAMTGGKAYGPHSVGMIHGISCGSCSIAIGGDTYTSNIVYSSNSAIIGGVGNVLGINSNNSVILGGQNIIVTGNTSNMVIVPSLVLRGLSCWIYFGDPNIDNTWRLGVSGGSFIHQVKQSGFFITKDIIAP